MIWDNGSVVEFWKKNKETAEVEKLTFTMQECAISDDTFIYDFTEYQAFDNNTLNNLYAAAATDADKMEELKQLLEVFQSN